MGNRALGMEKLLNARQLGGYKTADGRSIRRNVLLRSAKLADASEGDIARLRDIYKLRRIIDFRTSGEMALGPDPEIEGVEYIRIKVIDEDAGMGEVAKSIPGATLDIGATIRGMLELIRGNYVNDRLYIEQIASESGRRGYRAFFDELLNHGDGAILWHCTSGKDRTGIATVLVLTALGIDKETILQDFALSNEFHARNVDYIMREAARFTDDERELEGMLVLAGVSRVYMEKMFDFVEEKYGSLLNYMQREMGIAEEEIRALRDKYLA